MYWKRSCKPKITEYNATLVRNQNVVGLEITVDDVGWFKKVEAAEGVVEDADYVIFWEFGRTVFAEERMHVSLDEAHDHEQVVEGEEVGFAIDGKNDV